ncbi:MAG: metallophosphoesterase [Firmicutes bacterium]|uniref:Metallophosphoesterase n=1 Tax=Candidatus Onthovivens merdipullorum TaxID=2840889 RepID=A0A9D9DIH8_9BACL|nr:metallophosphoesterase [Candidatus Onthovivens merdipullorum]
MSKLKCVLFAMLGIVSLGAVSCSTEDITCFPDDRPIRTISENYVYTLEEKFDKSLDSFEAWILAPQDSIGGTIFGNYYNDNRGMPGATVYSLDALGRVCISWNFKQYTYTFPTRRLDDGKWHHIAVIRQIDPSNSKNSKFALYINGEFIEDNGDYVRADDNYSLDAMAFRIGVDYSQWMNQKTPFDGYIRQVTCYNGTISEDRIKLDMQTKEITDTNNGTLLGNYYLGNNWREEVVKESSGNGNDAVLGTFEKYVDYTQTNDYDYTIVGIPDIQTITRYKTNDVYNLFNWISNNAVSQKIAFCLQTGDLSDVGGTIKYYQTSADAMQILYDTNIPISFVQGNHDYDNNSSGNDGRESENYNKYFPISKWGNTPWFGGAFEEGSMSNTYYLYDNTTLATSCGVNALPEGSKYLVLNLEFGPRQSVIRWANDLCQQYSDYRVIMLTHDYLDANGLITDGDDRADPTNYGFASSAGATSGIELYNGLVKKNNNMFMTVSGHINSDDIVYMANEGDKGNKINNFLIDVQASQYTDEFGSRSGIGLDMICLYRVNEEKKEIYTEYYSPKFNKWWNIQNQFTVSFADPNNPTVGA